MAEDSSFQRLDHFVERLRHAYAWLKNRKTANGKDDGANGDESEIVPSHENGS